MQPGAVKQFGRRGAEPGRPRADDHRSIGRDASKSREDVVVSMIRDFIGSNHARFETVVDAMARRQDGFRSIVFGGSIVLLLVPTVWFLYRKMWLAAASSIVVCGIGGFLAGRGLGFGLVMVPGVAACCFGKSLYVRGAAESVRQILATEISPLASLVEIRAKGGTAPGAVWAALAVTPVLGLITVLTTHGNSWA